MFAGPPNGFACAPAEITDGMSNTLMFAESAGGTTLYNRKKVNRGPNSSAFGHIGGINRLLAQPFSYDGAVAYAGNCVVNCTNGGGNAFGFHPGGANVALCDGSVRFLKETLAVATMLRLVGRDEGGIIGADEF
jgi:prepilin-type processing-associated H-X9-DG protein